MNDSQDLDSHRSMTSLVSYPMRCPLWGDGRFHGNCDGTLFKDLVLRYRPKRVADPMMGSGTTRDVIAWLKGRGLAIDYWGADLRTGFNCERDSPPGVFDLAWVHPPYWNIVTYSDDPKDLSSEPHYRVFIARLARCLSNCSAALRPGGLLAVLVADVRRQGVYYPLGQEVMNMAPVLGQVCSVIIKTQHNCRSDGKAYASMTHPPIRHEYCILFERRREHAGPVYSGFKPER